MVIPPLAGIILLITITVSADIPDQNQKENKIKS